MVSCYSPVSLPFSLGTQFAVVNKDDYDLKGAFGCLDKAQKFALAGELVIKCRLQPLEVCPNPYDTTILRKKP